MEKDGTKITPRQGTYITGFANAAGTLMSCFIVKHLNRKPLLIWGHIGMAMVHAGVGVFALEGMNEGVLAMVILFLFVYANTSGVIGWLYAAETVVDVALGVCMMTLWLTVLILSFVCPILMSKDSIGIQNVFFIFSGISLVGSAFCYYFIKETQGLSDREKK
jgi:hypothetical protein